MTNKMVNNNESKELNPKIEKMTEADIETVMKIESKSFDFPWGKKKSFTEYTVRGDAFIVRTKQKILVGYALIKRNCDTIVLYKMATDPEYRRKGLGKFTTEWIQKFVKDQRFTKLLLHVRASNHPAINLYKKTGFKKIQSKKGHYKKGSNTKEKTAIEMQWMCSN
jgi:ribosomal-protein-alanine N-acetyltransferase